MISSSVGGKASFVKGGSLTAKRARFSDDFVASGRSFKAAIKVSNFKRGVIVKSGRSFQLEGSKVKRGVKLAKVRSTVTIRSSKLSGGIQIRSSGRSRILRSSISGGLACFANRPAPTVDRSSVKGRKTGQCR